MYASIPSGSGLASSDKAAFCSLSKQYCENALRAGLLGATFKSINRAKISLQMNVINIIFVCIKSANNLLNGGDDI